MSTFEATTAVWPDVSELEELSVKILKERSEGVLRYLSRMAQHNLSDAADIVEKMRAHQGNVVEVLLDLGFPVSERLKESISVLPESSSWLKIFFEALYLVHRFDRGQSSFAVTSSGNGHPEEEARVVDDVKEVIDGEDKLRQLEDSVDLGQVQEKSSESNYDVVRRKLLERMGSQYEISSKELSSFIGGVVLEHNPSFDKRGVGGLMSSLVRGKVLVKTEKNGVTSYKLASKDQSTEQGVESVADETFETPKKDSSISSAEVPDISDVQKLLDEICLKIKECETQRTELETQFAGLEKKRGSIFLEIQRLRCAQDVISEISNNDKRTGG